MLPLQGVWVLSLVRDLRSCLPCDGKTKQNNTVICAVYPLPPPRKDGTCFWVCVHLRLFLVLYPLASGSPCLFLSVSSSFGLLLLAVTVGSWPIDSFRHSYVKLTLKMDPGPSPTRQPWECRRSPVYLSQLYTPPFFSVFIDLLPTNCTSNVYSVCVVCEVCGVL